MDVPPELYALLCAALRRETADDLPLPAVAAFDTVYHIEPHEYRGLAPRGGWSMHFLITRDPEPRLDFYAIGDDYSKHRRIDAAGAVTALEEYEGQCGRRVYPDDCERTAQEHARIDAHNARVYALLKAKGFER